MAFTRNPYLITKAMRNFLWASILTMATHSRFSMTRPSELLEANCRNIDSSSAKGTSCFMPLSLSKHRRVAMV